MCRESEVYRDRLLVYVLQPIASLKDQAEALQCLDVHH